MAVGTARSVTDVLMNVTPSTEPEEFVFDDYTQRIAVAVFTVLISVFGLIGNFLVLFAVSLSRTLQTKVNVFVINLSVADSIICCVLPFNAVALLSQEGWPLSSHLCAAAAGFLWIGLGSGTVTLALIAFNRYYVIKHYNFDKAYTSKRIAFMITFAWLYPGILTILATNLGLGRLGYSDKYKACLQDSSHPLTEYLSLFAGIVVFLPSLTVIIFCYVRIFLHIRKHHRHLIRIFIIGGGQNNRNRNSTIRRESVRNEDVMNESVRINLGMENPATPRTPTRVHFVYPPEGLDGTDKPNNVGTVDTPDTPKTRESVQESPSVLDEIRAPQTPSAASLVPASPTNSNAVESPRIGKRTRSVSEELSYTVSRRQADITRNVFYVVCAFLICLTPYGIAILIPNSDPGIPWLMLLLQFNTCVNPVIYALKHPTFGQVIPRILRCDFANIPSQSAWLKKLSGKN